MKTTKLVLGILTIVLSCFVTFQSCAVGVSNSLSENGESGGSFGLFVSILMLSGAIVMIATRKNTGKGGSVACAILFLLAAALGAIGADSYTDLKIWAGLCGIIGVINIIAAIKKKKVIDSSPSDSDN